MTPKIGNILALALLTLVAAAPARAADTVEAQTPTFFVTGTGGYSIYKSEMVQSNETSTTVGYGFGVYAGNDRNIGMALKRESSAFAFELNNATIAMDWQDVHLRYRWGPVWVGALFTSSTWKVTAPPDADANDFLDQDTDAEEYLDILTTGYGLNTGVSIPLNKRTALYADVVYATTGAVQQAQPAEASTAGVTGTSPSLERVVTLGPRMDLDLGGSLGLTKGMGFSMIGGFKYRTYQITIEDSAFAEQLNTTYVGFMSGWVF